MNTRIIATALTTVKGVATLLVAVAALLNAKSGNACSVRRIPGPAELVSGAELIVHATAVDYAGPVPRANSVKDARGQDISIMAANGVTNTKARFRIESLLKGSYAEKELELDGHLGSEDDWNEQGVPYTFVRENGRSGSCFANTYRKGGQYLLMLRRVTAPRYQGDTAYTVDWAALAPVNEQVRSANDPWITWVKEQIQKVDKDAFAIVLDGHSLQSTPRDPAHLAEIRKKVDEIDFWNVTKYPPLFGSGSIDRTCDSLGSQRFEITVNLGTKTKNLLWMDSTCPKALDSKAAQDLMSLVEMIKKAAPSEFVVK